MMAERLYNVLGLMSGTSLDGLDMALVRFQKFEETWNYECLKAITYPYKKDWMNKLQSAPSLGKAELFELHAAYGDLLGGLAKDFLGSIGADCDMISSHGHTVHHDPEGGYTFQLGDGNRLASTSGFKVLADFRSQDIALGGQGAPLAPFGDRMLFGAFDACLNLGGISNVSLQSDNKRVGFDLTGCNILLNCLAEREGKAFDKNGLLASSGKVIPQLLNKMNEWPFLKQEGPKSLHKDDVLAFFIPLMDETAATPDLLRTTVTHIGMNISSTLNQHLGREARVLVSGGGAWNKFLLEELRNSMLAEIFLPSKEVVDFKEAIIFAFLGLMRSKGEVNVLAAVTGASNDHSAGQIFEP